MWITVTLDSPFFYITDSCNVDEKDNVTRHTKKSNVGVNWFTRQRGLILVQPLTESTSLCIVKK